MYRALDLAKYIVNKCTADKMPVSNLQLQKILYYIQKAFLNVGEPAFSDEIEAWQFGPVVPAVYYHFSGFGAMPITMNYSPVQIKPKDKVALDKVIEVKRILDPWQMVSETHKPNGAWAQTYQNGKGKGHVIPVQLIQEVG